jgi:outer membrane protein TolC
LPDLNLTAEGTLPTDDDDSTGGVSLSTDDARYRVGATLSLPLDRTNERLAVRSAQIRLERAERDHDRLTDNVVVESRAAVRAVEVARFQLNLAEQQVEINRRRLRGQKLQEDTLRPQDIVDTENELLQAENDRDRARTRLRSAVLAYLLSTDQLRVTRAGSLQALPFE